MNTNSCEVSTHFWFLQPDAVSVVSKLFVPPSSSITNDSPILGARNWWPYTLGPIGSIQPFETRHGEWGPPIQKVTDMDWEIYSVWLIISDLVLSIAWHFFVLNTLVEIRVRWLSPTFRFSVGYMFGCVRLSVIMYFFRAKPTALYIYLHFFSFFLHSTIGILALVFNEGPWKNLRPNSIGMYQSHPLNPYNLVPSMLHKLRNLAEHCLWGVLQWLVTTVSRAKSSWSERLLPWTQFRLMPNTVLEEMESRLPTQLGERLNRFRESYNSNYFGLFDDEDARQDGDIELRFGRASDQKSGATPGFRVIPPPSRVREADDIVFLDATDSVVSFTSDRDGGLRDGNGAGLTTQANRNKNAAATPNNNNNAGLSNTGEGQQTNTGEDPSSTGKDPSSTHEGRIDEVHNLTKESRNNTSDLGRMWSAPVETEICADDEEQEEEKGLEDMTCSSHQSVSSKGRPTSDDDLDASHGFVDAIDSTNHEYFADAVTSVEDAALTARKAPATDMLPESEDAWIFENPPEIAPDVMLRGPGDFKLSVSPTKWNESLLFWARPSLENYFLSHMDGDEDDLNQESEPELECDPKMQGDPGFCSNVRGTLTLRGDGILLSINPTPPILRTIASQGLKSQSDPVSTREVVVELVGKRVQCKSGNKVLYMYAEYREYGMKLNTPQKSTMAWLLNTLNGVHDAIGLRAYRCANFTKHPSYFQTVRMPKRRSKKFSQRLMEESNRFF